MIICKEGDCFTCPYPDCIGTIKGGKVGRKPISREEKLKRKREYNKKYYATHKEQMSEYHKEWYRRKCMKED